MTIGIVLEYVGVWLLMNYLPWMGYTMNRMTIMKQITTPIMPIIFFGPQDSYVCMWIEENNLGFHFSKINQNYHKLNMYRKSIFQFNQMNPDSKKIQAISKIIIE
jgi:hypothetical protein